MVLYQLKLAWRKAIKNQYPSLFNILGLSVGFACTFLLLAWVAHELSYDSFFENKENIYRVNFAAKSNDKYIKVCSSPQGIGTEAMKTIPRVENYTRIRIHTKTPFKVGENLFYVDQGLSADSTFFGVFSFEAVQGDLQRALSQRDLVIINESIAEQCFGLESALGRMIQVDGHKYTVSAVIKDVPSTSHIQFHFILPTLNLPEQWHNNQWGSDNCTQYLVLMENADRKAIEKQLTQMGWEKNEEWKEYEAKVSLQPLEEIHFSKGYALENAVKGSKQNIYILISVAFLVLFIACVNFTNMFISTTLKSTSTFGVKIASGASKKSILKELAIEVTCYVFISFVISLSLAKLLFSVFNRLVDIPMEFPILNGPFLLICAGQIVLVLLFAILFPWLFISKINASYLLKGTFTVDPGKRHRVQRVLVTLQFVIAIVLIISAGVIQKQIDFLRSKSLGFDKEQLVYIQTLGAFNTSESLDQMKNVLLANSNIKGISARSCLPTEIENGGYLSSINDQEYKVHGEMINVAEDYFDLMKIEWLEGSQQFNYTNAKKQFCVLNETAAQKLKLKPPYCGQSIISYNDGASLTICGVIQDINTKSLSEKVKPCMYTKAIQFYNPGIILFKLSDNYKDAISAIEDYCRTNNRNIPFEYYFLDETYDRLYKSEARMRSILGWFSLISIILTSMGLLAMAYFIIESRTKEIGVRKVNGAKTKEIMAMLNKDFIKWVGIAFVTACPISWYAMNRWLENFAYKTELSWWIFLLAGAIVMGIALLTVSFQAWRAASRNPVDSLRYE